MCQDFFLDVLSSLFGLDEVGSIISDIISLFHTFQKIGAIRSFSAHFSKEAYKLFSWAKNILDLIKHLFYFRPLQPYDNYYLYDLATPLAILLFTVTSTSFYNIFGYYIVYFIFLVFGYGIGCFGIDKKMSLICVFGSLGAGIVIFFVNCKCQLFEFINCQKMDEPGSCCCCKNAYSVLGLTFTLSQSILIFSILITPILLQSEKLTLLYTILIIAIIFLVLILETIYLCVKKQFFNYQSSQRKEQKRIAKFISFGIEFYPILIIPGTEYFITIINDYYKNNWRVIIGYVFFIILVPITVTYLIADTKDLKLAKKFRSEKLEYFTLFEYIKDVAFAIVASYDFQLACIIIEGAFFLLILIFRPYKNISYYILSCGNSAVVVIENIVVWLVDRKGNEIIDFKKAILMVVCACIPVVVALYIYYIFDYDIYGSREESDDDDESLEKNDDDEDPVENVFILGLLIKVGSPIAWTAFGITIPILKYSNGML